MIDARNNVRNAVGNAENGIENVAKDVKNGVSDMGNTAENTVTNDSYTATRTDAEARNNNWYKYFSLGYLSCNCSSYYCSCLVLWCSDPKSPWKK